LKLRRKVAVLVGALVLAAAPASALAVQPADPGSQGKAKAQEHATPGPNAPLPEKAKAYGRYCNEENRKHVAGERGTPFSQCVTAMAKAANNEKLTPSQACKETSRKHVAGEKGTPFSRCVVAAAQVREDQQG
jgi:hypothetical protein